MALETQAAISAFWVDLSCRVLSPGNLSNINAGMAKAFAAQREEWKRVDAAVYRPAPLFTPEEIETVRNAAETIESEWPGHSKPAKLRRIAEKMSAPSEKP